MRARLKVNNSSNQKGLIVARLLMANSKTNEAGRRNQFVCLGDMSSISIQPARSDDANAAWVKATNESRGN
jgi:hypothetical protein